MRKVVAITLVLLMLVTGCSRKDPSRHVKAAEEAFARGEYAESRELYLKHIALREKATSRATWENPAFYQLAIGATYLAEGNSEQAIACFESALAHQVEPLLVADKILLAAEALLQQKKALAALKLLEKHQHINPKLFYGALDRTAKAIEVK